MKKKSFGFRFKWEQENLLWKFVIVNKNFEVSLGTVEKSEKSLDQNHH